MPAEMKPVLERQMEIYAAFLEHTDHHVGRLVGALENMGILEDTLIYYIVGDNGASGEGSLNGTLNELLMFNGILGVETADYLKANLAKFGTSDSFGHYSYGWAHAMDTPYQWVKQTASHFGGTRNGAVVHWPNGIKGKGEVRHQFHHVIDIAPTVLEAAHLPMPTLVEGVQQTPMHGVSMKYSFDDPKAAERHTTQYFEILGNRGIYHHGWVACTKHRTPWKTKPDCSFADDVWELYDTTKDWSESKNVAKDNPEKLAELQTLFLLEADRYLVTPLDDRSVERFNPELAGRPALIKGDKQILFPGMKRLSENSVIVIKNKSHAITANIVVAQGKKAEGTIVSQGGKFGGWSLYAKNGKAKYCYNYMSLESFYVESDREIPAGEHQVRMEFTYDGGGLGKGGTAALFIDGKKAGEGRVKATAMAIFSCDETLDLGEETGTAVADDCTVPNRFNSAIQLVQIDAKLDGKDHYLTPEQLHNIAMARQ
jgi:arylsulfatase